MFWVTKPMSQCGFSGGRKKEGWDFHVFFLGLPFGDLLVETFEGQFWGSNMIPKTDFI